MAEIEASKVVFQQTMESQEELGELMLPLFKPLHKFICIFAILVYLTFL